MQMQKTKTEFKMQRAVQNAKSSDRNEVSYGTSIHFVFRQNGTRRRASSIICRLNGIR